MAGHDCQQCGRPMRKINRYGFCNRSAACKREYDRVRYERRTGTEARRDVGTEARRHEGTEGEAGSEGQSSIRLRGGDAKGEGEWHGIWMSPVSPLVAPGGVVTRATTGKA